MRTRSDKFTKLVSAAEFRSAGNCGESRHHWGFKIARG
eukprot:CAMPEP_0114300882 /NCGR_PEP_ID=MMETSP0059-20121206/13800_1 /TAXON_ID=36894 /ORGANISM="Pyramimonas parkeae, Strain CCMP726" /LENGTH=37 /DNA_ID= /DNA_START= /DNA_END= /DNA_ORIENTATION=